MDGISAGQIGGPAYLLMFSFAGSSQDPRYAFGGWRQLFVVQQVIDSKQVFTGKLR